MLIIRKEQLEAMEAKAAGTFERELVEHVKTFSPRHAAVVGDANIEAMVSQGIERAKQYAMDKRGPVRFFVEMMVMFGSEFDTDPLLPWANGVLTNPSIHDQMERADILHEAMLEYVEEVAGKDKKFLFDSIKRFGNSRLEDYQAKGTNFDTAIKEMLRANYPEKCKYLGESGMNTLVDHGKEEAHVRSITSAKGAALLIVLIFQLGHGATRDPMFPWISETLDDESVEDPNERIKNLRAKAVKYSDQMLKNLGQE